MVSINDDKSFKLALITEDLQGDQSKDGFAAVCEQARAAMDTHDIGSDFRRAYLNCMSNPTILVSQVQADMMDNYMIAAFACIELGLSKHFPLIAWAALNKMDFEGLHGEIACMRALMWGGFDVNGQTQESGISALHAMCNLKWGKGAHPRAVHHLIENGANVDIQSATGDTPMITLCGNATWNEDIDRTFYLLFDAGADLEMEADDGASAWLLLQSQQKKKPHPLREQLISDLSE
ncbi:hypothetical protein OX462_12290 [Janthinobacterium sp. SUN098]|uniref:hypothetical protein n=1 Tax=Janthinobacterium sp. SUN098 TaxID=3002437 RepID=UPI0038D37254